MPRRPACSATWTYSEETPDATAAAFRGARRGPAPAVGRGRGLHPLVQRRGLRVHPLQPGAGTPGRPGAPGHHAAPADPRRAPGEPRPDPLRHPGRRPPAPGRRSPATAPEPRLDSRRSLPAAGHHPWQRLDESLGEPPDSGELLAGIERQARDLDLVGIYAAGPLFRGFANSWGRSAGMPAAASTSTGACSTPTARRSRPTTPASTGMANASPSASSRRANSLATWASRCAS